FLLGYVFAFIASELSNVNFSSIGTILGLGIGVVGSAALVGNPESEPIGKSLSPCGRDESEGTQTSTGCFLFLVFCLL
ncbi:MAG: hypothetical protein Q7R50_03500, partial [Dehalococcoidales bacterium]|nr:hypothetical protein [Dehalococcoidales bacterium]